MQRNDEIGRCSCADRDEALSSRITLNRQQTINLCDWRRGKDRSQHANVSVTLMADHFDG